MLLLNQLRRLYRSLPRPPSTNYNLGQLKQNPYANLPQGALVVDLGSKSALGNYVFSTSFGRAKIIGVDIEPFEGVAVVADAHHLPFVSSSVDCVICVSVLQYVRQPKQVVDEIFRVLRPDGLVYLNVPFVARDAPDPEDLYRFSVSGIQVLCGSFEKIQAGFNRGPASTTCDLLVHFSAIVFCFNSKRIYDVLLDLFQWGLFWLKYVDRLIGEYEVARVIYSGAFFLGRKPVQSIRRPDSAE